MRTLPAVRHAQHVGRHHGAGKHARHRRGIGYVSFVDDGPYYYYDTYSDDDCAWLLRKARETGKRYWWQRYRECIEN